MIREIIDILVDGKSMNMEQASNVMDEIMEGRTTPGQLGAFLIALRLKGETPEEIAAMASVMARKSLRIELDEPIVDTCGTGGDGTGTFNISTVSAFVAAGAGLKVAKHGSRAYSSNSGSADVIEALGINLEAGPHAVKQCIQEVGIGFLFAPTFHPAMRHAVPVRREIGIRTIFNMLGPLTNPTGAKHQLLGVADQSHGEKMIQVLRLLGSQHSLVVHGEDGLDEMTLGAKTRVWELCGNAVKSYTISPSDFGLPSVPLQQLSGGSPEDNAFLLRRILMGEKGPHRDIVLLNTAGVLMVGGKTQDLEDGLTMAAEAIDNGEALLKLEALIELSQSLSDSLE